MIVNPNRKPQNPVGVSPHWEMFEQFRQAADLFGPMQNEITQQVSAIMNSSQPSPTIDARQLGASVISAMSSWWHGEFPRRFPQFPNGAERGIFGMVLWNHLASQQGVWWCFTEQPDTHGYGQNAMQYWMLQPNDPLIPHNC